MTHLPTRGARELEGRWTPSPVKAGAVRMLALALPLIAGWIAIQAVERFFFSPAGWLGIAIWLLQAIVVGTLVSKAVHRLAGRLLPLAFLLDQSLVFPDAAPSRFSMALRSNNLGPIDQRIEQLRNGDGDRTEQQAAVEALSLVAALSNHDRFTRGHTERVRAYADLIAVELGLSEADRARLSWGVLLHDIGKLTVPAEVLNKKSALTDDEWATLRDHPRAGAEIIGDLHEWLGDWGRAAGEHHERWDGGGYPNGLAGTEISLAGRITAVADAFDVIRSARSYKSPMSPEAARQELVRCAGAQFDPAVVRAMLQVSIGGQRNVGSLAWLSEIPAIVRTVGAAASSPAIAATTVAATLSVGASPLAPILDRVPAEVAFAAPDAFVDDRSINDIVVESVAATSASSPPVESTADETALDETAGPVPSPTLPGIDPEFEGSPGERAAPMPSTTTQAAPSGGSETTPTTGPATTTPNAAPTTTTDVDEPAAADGTTTVPTAAGRQAAPAAAADVVVDLPVAEQVVVVEQAIVEEAVADPVAAAGAPPSPPTAPTPFGKLDLYLSNSGDGDTDSQPVLPFTTNKPDGKVDNLDADRDNEDGLVLQRDNAGLASNDASKVQVWEYGITESVVIDDEVELEIWVAAEGFENKETIGVAIELLHCSGGTDSCTVIGAGSRTTESKKDWRKLTIDLGDLDATLLANDTLVLRVAVPDDLSDCDVLIAFDSKDEKSRLRFR